MSRKVDVYDDSGSKIGEIHENVDYEAKAARAITGGFAIVIFWIIAIATGGIFLLLWWLLKSVSRQVSHDSKSIWTAIMVGVPLAGLIAGLFAITAPSLVPSLEQFLYEHITNPFPQYVADNQKGIQIEQIQTPTYNAHSDGVGRYDSIGQSHIKRRGL